MLTNVVKRPVPVASQCTLFGSCSTSPVRPDNLIQCTCFEINFSGWQESLTVSSIICDCWWHLKIVPFECHRGWVETLHRPRLGHFPGRSGWFYSRPGTCLGSNGLSASVGVWRNCMLSVVWEKTILRGLTTHIHAPVQNLPRNI